MSLVIPAPAASAPKEEAADWLEVTALLAADGNSSIQDLIKVFTQTGSTDAIGKPDFDDPGEDEGLAGITDQSGELAQITAEDAFAEIEDRLSACGGRYPFTVGSQHLQVVDGYRSSSYVFLLLLSFFGVDAGPRGIKSTTLFEDLSLVAAEQYFGGRAAGARSYAFGFPRRITAPRFPDALERLCRELGEGAGSRARPTRRHKKDAKLDIVAWRPFDDGRSGKLIGFGQCAAGKGWRDKASELNPTAWCKTWMNDPPPVDPVPMFFVPHRVDNDEWFEISPVAGVIFDRCRIAYHTGLGAPPTPSRVVTWINHVLTYGSDRQPVRKDSQP